MLLFYHCLTLLLTIGMPLLIFIGLKKVLSRTTISETQQHQLWRRFVVLTTSYLIFVGIISYMGFLAFGPLPPPAFILVTLTLIVLLRLIYSKRAKELVLVTPAIWLIVIQSFRILVEIVLWGLYQYDLIPIQMTFEGRNFDILVGLTAPIIGYYCFIRKSWPEKVAYYWNIGGLFLLANIVLTAILSMPIPIRVFMNEPANRYIVDFPNIYIPLLFVPIAYSMHLLSIRQLRSRFQ